ncbi:MAG TPA: type II secretion system minor pseudopilin GspK [Ideonella sp.]|nr:type II secretion system minor pseudopilin GspK [Ideonella sp.]
MRRAVPLSFTRRTQRGAALLLAMLIVTLVATLAAGMVWQQWRAIEVESAERTRNQASWLLAGALDWARIILREDNKTVDALTEPWATGLADIRLSTFLAADKDNNSSADPGIDAFLSGTITDAQSRYNLHNLIEDDEETATLELQNLQRLCEVLGLPAETATRIAAGMRGAEAAEADLDEDATPAAGAPLPPQRPSQLTWLGLDAETVRRLSPFVVMLPDVAKVNINTAPPEVLMAVLPGLDRASAERLVQARQRTAFDTLDKAQALLPESIKLKDSKYLQLNTTYFEITGQLRYENLTLRELSLVRRNGTDVTVLRRERLPHE